MVLSIIFLEDKHTILLHLSIFYEYQQFFQHRICFSIQPPDYSDPWPRLARSSSFFLVLLFNNLRHIMLKTKYMKHYTSHKTMNLQSMHILFQNIKKKHCWFKLQKHNIYNINQKSQTFSPSEGNGMLHRRSLPRWWVLAGTYVWCLSLCICVSLVGEHLLLRTGWWYIL
jgi:hypothetical protein